MRTKILQGLEGISLQLDLPSSVQKITLLTDVFLRNIHHMTNSSFFKKYPALKNAKDFSIDDLKITRFKKFPYAEVLEKMQHERSSGGRFPEKHDYLIDLIQYDGYISLKTGNQSYQIPFSMVIGDTMDNYLYQNRRIEAGAPISKGGFLYVVKLGEVSEKFLFHSDISKPKKENNIIRHIDKEIIKMIFEQYDFSHIVLRSKYRRKPIEIKNLPSIREKEQNQEEVLDMLEKKHELPIRIFYEKQGTEKVEKTQEQGEYTEVFEKGQKLFEDNAEKIKPYVEGKDVFVDQGCLDGEKIFALIRKLHIETGEYMGTDISIESLLKLGQTKSNINSSILLDFNLSVLDFKDIEKLKNIQGKTVFNVGGTFGNIYQKGDNSFLEKTREILNDGEYLILGVFLHDENKKPEEIINLYKNPEGEDFVLNGFENAGFDRNCIEHQVEYNPDDRTVYIYGRCKEDIQKPCVLSKNTRILAFRSKRFTIPEIQELCKSANLKAETIATQDGQCLFAISKA